MTLPPTRRIRQLQTLTLAWMTLEAGVALAAAWRAHSVVLAAFGADSVIELLSAAVVLVALASPACTLLAGRVAGVLLLALAAVVALTASLGLAGAASPRSSPLGTALLLATAGVMPWLGRTKRQLARQTGNVALAADAVQSSTCAYLAWIALAGLSLNIAFAWSWADPVAALVLTPLIAAEGWKAVRSASPCTCC